MQQQQRNITIKLSAIIALFLCITGLVQAEPSQITGDVPTDFDQPDTLIYPAVPDDEPDADVDTFWDILNIHYDYDATTDTMYVGINCEGICSDADNDGNPDNDIDGGPGDGIVDYPDLDETESISMVIDPDRDGTYEYVVGITSEIGVPNDAASFGIYEFTGGPAAPNIGYGVPANSAAGVTATATLLFYPQGPSTVSTGDFEFSISDFSTLNGFSFTPGDPFSFNTVTFAGSQQDDTGEEFVPSAGSITVEYPGAAELGDYVWEDSNLDGLQTEGGTTGIAGVPVEAVFAGPDGTFGTADDETFNTTTDASGLYLFSPLEPGDYRVTFPDAATINYDDRTTQNADGATGDAGDNNQDSDADETTGETTTITLETSESDLRWDAGYYNFASIGDYVWEDTNIDGVQNEGGTTGLENVTVNLTGTDALGNTVSQTTTTDASGFYLFDNLIPGDYQVEFVAPAGYTTSPQNQTGGAGDAADAPDDSDADITTGQTTTVTLSSGEEDLRWDAGYYLPSQLGDFVWLDEDRDGIQDDGEPGVSGVTVTLYDSDRNQLQTTTTDANGLYLFDNLLPGDYIVGFNSPPGLTFTSRNIGGDDSVDSDASRSTGRTGVITLPYDTSDLTWDAGLYESPSTPTPPPNTTPDTTPDNGGDDAAATATFPTSVQQLPDTGETPPVRNWLMLLIVMGGSALMTAAGLLFIGRDSR